VLKDCIRRTGSLEAGLRSYVGAANSGEDGGYAAKVLAQQGILRLVASGGKVRTTAAVTPVAKARSADVATPAPTAEPQATPSADPAPAPDKIAFLR
jgi:hypothetical protein